MVTEAGVRGDIKQTAAATATAAGVTPAWPGPARPGSLLWRQRRDHERSPGDTGQGFDPIREKASGGGGVFDEWQVEGEEHAAHTEVPKAKHRNQNVPAPAGSLKCVFDGPSPLESQSAVIYSGRQGKGTEGVTLDLPGFDLPLLSPGPVPPVSFQSFSLLSSNQRFDSCYVSGMSTAESVFVEASPDAPGGIAPPQHV